MTVFAVVSVWPLFGHAEDSVKAVRKAVERITLDQTGTKPFHLKAVLAPSFQRDRDCGRTGEVEIWWESPTRWKRELRSPEFHQIEIVDGTRDWEKNDGDFFPEWLRETAVELINPVPPVDEVLQHVKAAEVRQIGPMTNFNWTTATGTADVHNIVRSDIAIQGSTGLVLYAGGLGWGGEFKDYSSFHGRMIARTVNLGDPQVTARVTTLEDLGDGPAAFFDAEAKDGDPQPLRTILVDETSLRKNLLPMAPVVWPALQDGPLEGNVTTDVVVDRDGRVRELGVVVSENFAANEAGKQALLAMRFKPFVVDGVPVQVMSQITLPFKSTRPAGAETFDSARSYFERGRRLSFPAAAARSPYILRAEFEARGSATTIENGQYEDTWVSDSQWRREAWFSKSKYVRSRNGDKTYQLAEGPDAGLLGLVLRVSEPIPATDTFTEADWRMRRDTVDGIRTVQVLTGYENPEGKLDPESRSYWFDDTGTLVKTHFNGLETRRSEFEEFAGVKVARRIDVFKDGKLAMGIRVTEVSPAGPVPTKTFEVRGHEWTRAFTSEVR